MERSRRALYNLYLSPGAVGSCVWDDVLTPQSLFLHKHGPSTQPSLIYVIPCQRIWIWTVSVGGDVDATYWMPTCTFTHN